MHRMGGHVDLLARARCKGQMPDIPARCEAITLTRDLSYSTTGETHRPSGPETAFGAARKRKPEFN